MRGCLYYERSYGNAMEDFNKAITLDPNLAKNYKNRGLVYKQLGDMGKAISDFQKVCDMGFETGCKYL